MNVKEISYPIKTCPFCTIPVFIDCPCLCGDGKEIKYDYYGALKAVTDIWNKMVND